MEFDDATKIIKGEASSVLGERDGSRAFLVVLAGPDTGATHELEDLTVIGRSSDATLSLDQEGISRIHCKLLKINGNVELRDAGSTNGTFVNGERVEKCRLQDGDKIQLAPQVHFKFTLHDELEHTFREQMYDAALRDPLTRVYNKRYFSERLETEWAYSDRHRMPLSLVMMDLDHFKLVNDQFGHLAGDYVLRDFADVVADTVRTEDVLCRYGGEEFAVICREFPIPSAQIMADRIRRSVANHEFMWESKRIPVTVSAGLAGVPHDSIVSQEALVEAADQALYAAKGGGRNRVCVHGKK
jgi:diguanylate cyclase (GGDEF)-like protein